MQNKNTEKNGYSKLDKTKSDAIRLTKELQVKSVLENIKTQ